MFVGENNRSGMDKGLSLEANIERYLYFQIFKMPFKVS